MTGDERETAATPTAPWGGRPLSLLEVVVGAGIVIGHNVFHVIPNEVPILFVLGIVSIRLRNGSWRAVGLTRPNSWRATIAIAALAAAVALLVGQFVTEPLSHVMGLPAAKSAATSLGLKRGDWLSLAGTLAVIWTFAAFGEEVAYRRYLLGRAADIGGGSTRAHWIALVCASPLFGIGHFYQGPSGMFETACDGFLIGAAYLLSGRNLWVAILTHGFIDTTAFLAIFTGLAD